MFDIEFSIWLASQKQWVHLVKTIQLVAVPRVGEFMKFNNHIVGDYFGWKVSEVTYRENGKIEVSTELLDNIDQRMYSFEDDEEFNEYYESYLAEGWISPHGIKPNKQCKNLKPKA